MDNHLSDQEAETSVTYCEALYAVVRQAGADCRQVVKTGHCKYLCLILHCFNLPLNGIVGTANNLITINHQF